jgi:uncharacterized protein DUF3800
MRHLSKSPIWYFIDEAGDPTVYGPAKKVIVGTPGCSRVFLVGFLRTKDPQQIREKLSEVRLAVAGSAYLKNVPSVQKSLLAFHANEDCTEVRMMVYEALLKTDFKAQIVVARKIVGMFRDQFNDSEDRFYDHLVTYLLRNRLHLYTPTTIIFSRRGNRSRQRSLREAVEFAVKQFRDENPRASQVDIEVDVQTNQPIQEPVLQAIDYVVWAVQRAYEKNEMRYFDYLRDRIELVSDIFDFKKHRKGEPRKKNHYERRKNPFDISKVTPLRTIEVPASLAKPHLKGNGA